MAVAAIATVFLATLISAVVDDGMVAGDEDAAISIGLQMILLALLMGVAMAIAASQAVFLSQGAAFLIRRRLYDQLQEYSFENFDHRPTSQLMVRLNADAVNIRNAVMYAVMLGSFAPFILLTTLVLAIVNTPPVGVGARGRDRARRRADGPAGAGFQPLERRAPGPTRRCTPARARRPTRRSQPRRRRMRTTSSRRCRTATTRC